MMARFRNLTPPILIGLGSLIFWEITIHLFGVPSYAFPGPLLILKTLWVDGPLLIASLWITLKITLVALLAAALGGAGLAIVMSRASWLERSLMPYAVIAQVTPIVAIAPLIIIWIDSTIAAMAVCAWIVAFFPVLANTMAGLKSPDKHLHDLFRLYGASRVQTQALLEGPTALPYFLEGLRISGSFALIGSVVAEFVAGSGGVATGLAFRILEASYQLQIPRLLAALVLLLLTGIVIYVVLSWFSKWSLRRCYGGEE